MAVATIFLLAGSFAVSLSCIVILWIYLAGEPNGTPIPRESPRGGRPMPGKRPDREPHETPAAREVRTLLLGYFIVIGLISTAAFIAAARWCASIEEGTLTSRGSELAELRHDLAAEQQRYDSERQRYDAALEELRPTQTSSTPPGETTRQKYFMEMAQDSKRRAEEARASVNRVTDRLLQLHGATSTTQPTTQPTAQPITQRSALPATDRMAVCAFLIAIASLGVSGFLAIYLYKRR